MRLVPSFLASLLAAAAIAAAIPSARAAAAPAQKAFDCPAMLQESGSLTVTVFTQSDGNCTLGLHCIATLGVRISGVEGDSKACWYQTLTGLRHCSEGIPPSLYVEFLLDAACGGTDSQTFFTFDALNVPTATSSVTLYCDAC